VVLVGCSLKKPLGLILSIAPFGVLTPRDSLSLGEVGSYILDFGSISKAMAYLHFAYI